jgi:hypothetical protein
MWDVKYVYEVYKGAKKRNKERTHMEVRKMHQSMNGETNMNFAEELFLLNDNTNAMVTF